MWTLRCLYICLIYWIYESPVAAIIKVKDTMSNPTKTWESRFFDLTARNSKQGLTEDEADELAEMLKRIALFKGCCSWATGIYLGVKDGDVQGLKQHMLTSFMTICIYNAVDFYSPEKNDEENDETWQKKCDNLKTAVYQYKNLSDSDKQDFEDDIRLAGEIRCKVAAHMDLKEADGYINPEGNIYIDPNHAKRVNRLAMFLTEFVGSIFCKFPKVICHNSGVYLPVKLELRQKQKAACEINYVRQNRKRSADTSNKAQAAMSGEGIKPTWERWISAVLDLSDIETRNGRNKVNPNTALLPDVQNLMVETLVKINFHIAKLLKNKSGEEYSRVEELKNLNWVLSAERNDVAHFKQLKETIDILFIPLRKKEGGTKPEVRTFVTSTSYSLEEVTSVAKYMSNKVQKKQVTVKHKKRKKRKR